MASIIKGVREYMAACPLLAEIPLKDRHIDWTSDTAGNYGIFVDSDVLAKPFISGGGKYEYNFVLQARLSTLDGKMLENAEFVERMGDWCAAQSAAKNFPAMPKGCTPTKLSAANGMLFERDKTGKTGLYQIQFKLNYIKSGGN
ncbi:MAG: hypothetical protein J6C96_03890 [Oscillospiraceae bacterium]|nr:hypothetical protein [Oscillospiraceae bacterium]